jgi:hypothetical protein
VPRTSEGNVVAARTVTELRFEDADALLATGVFTANARPLNAVRDAILDTKWSFNVKTLYTWLILPL